MAQIGARRPMSSTMPACTAAGCAAPTSSRPTRRWFRRTAILLHHQHSARLRRRDRGREPAGAGADDQHVAGEVGGVGEGVVGAWGGAAAWRIGPALRRRRSAPARAGGLAPPGRTLRKNGDVPLAAAICRAVSSNGSGASACMRASVSRAEGPAIVITPIGGAWPCSCTTAATRPGAGGVGVDGHAVAARPRGLHHAPACRQQRARGVEPMHSSGWPRPWREARAHGLVVGQRRHPGQAR